MLNNSYFSASSWPCSSLLEFKGLPSGPKWGAGGCNVFWSGTTPTFSLDLSTVSLTGGLSESLGALEGAPPFFSGSFWPAVVGLPPFFFFLFIN